MKPIDGKGTTLLPLIQTGTQSMEIDVAKVRTNPDVIGLFREYVPSGETRTLAARVIGKPTTAFPDGPPPLPEGQIALPGDATSESHITTAL